VPAEEALVLSEKYGKEAGKYKAVYFIGRLAEYKYCNMDQVIKRTLDVFEDIV
jgi:UDP-galactopyranose mutase